MWSFLSGMQFFTPLFILSCCAIKISVCISRLHRYFLETGFLQEPVLDSHAYQPLNHNVLKAHDNYQKSTAPTVKASRGIVLVKHSCRGNMVATTFP